MNECGWFPCPQETFGDDVFCYFHRKRIEGFIDGYIPGPGLATYREPSAKVRKLIESSRDYREKEEDK